VSEPLALNVPVSGEPEASVRLAAPENTLVPDMMTGAFVTLNVNSSPLAVPEIEKLSIPPASTEPENPDPVTVVLPKPAYRPVPLVIVAEPLTEPEPASTSTGKVMVPRNVPWPSVTVNGTVTLPPLTLASEPFALKVPVSVPTPLTVSVAGPETDTLVPDVVMEALVTVNVKFSIAA